MMWGYGPAMGGWATALMGFGMVLFWAAVIVGLIVLIRLLVRPAAPPSASTVGGPEATLAERYARGEIDAEEYRTRLATLRE